MSNQQDDSVFVRNFSLVLLFLVVVGLTAFVLAKIVNGGAEDKYGPRGNEAANVAPVGAVNTGGDAVAVAGAKTGAEVASTAAPAAAASSDPGKSTYDSVCFACHAQGIAGAPKYGDVAAWEKPRRAGPRHPGAARHRRFHRPGGHDAGARWQPDPDRRPGHGRGGIHDGRRRRQEGGRRRTGRGPRRGAGRRCAGRADAAAAAPAVADAGKGKATYDAVCFVCHTPGAAGAPKFGDKAAWEPRIAKGIDVLHGSAINGFMGSAGMMPPKGGRPDLADADVKAAVDYMVEAAK